MVQPGVSAFGKKNNTTLFPRKSFNDTSLLFSSGKVNSGALSLVFMGTPLRTWLYRKPGWAVIWVAVLTIIPVGYAQFAKKSAQSKGPRALGIVEFLPNGKARLRPICIMVDGRFYDANIYKADPVPMALDKGIVYDGERAGESQGLFTIQDVLQNKQSFFAEGSWMPASAEPPKSGAMKAETKPKEDEEEKPPVLRRPGTESPKGETAPADTKTAQSQPPQNTPKPENTSSKSEEDSDRPRLKKPQAEQPSSTPAPTPSSQPAAAAPGTQAASSTSDENDPDRPQLRRGKPQPPKPAASKSTSAMPAKPATAASATTATKSEHQIIAAISDADGPEPRPYTYDTTPKEEQAFRTKVLGLAGQELVSKARELEPGLTLPTSHTLRTGKAGTKASPIQPVWDDVNFRVFDVATSNEPILVVTAKGHFPAPAPHTAKSTSDDSTSIEFYVTTVAHSDLYGELRSLFSAVTDDRTLDVTPKYQLIDVVDADGDGRGELLFRRTSDQGTSYGIYRVGADRLWPLYEGTASGQ
jgi:hypothetical protein